MSWEVLDGDAAPAPAAAPEPRDEPPAAPSRGERRPGRRRRVALALGLLAAGALAVLAGQGVDDARSRDQQVHEQREAQVARERARAVLECNGVRLALSGTCTRYTADGTVVLTRYLGTVVQGDAAEARMLVAVDGAGPVTVDEAWSRWSPTQLVGALPEPVEVAPGRPVEVTARFPLVCESPSSDPGRPLSAPVTGERRGVGSGTGEVRAALGQAFRTDYRAALADRCPSP